MSPDAQVKFYDEVEDLTKLSEVIEGYLEDYNQMSKAPMSLVLFR